MDLRTFVQDDEPPRDDDTLESSTEYRIHVYMLLFVLSVMRYAPTMLFPVVWRAFCVTNVCEVKEHGLWPDIWWVLSQLRLLRLRRISHHYQTRKLFSRFSRHCLSL